MNMILHPTARILVASIFIVSAAGKIFGFAATAGMMAKLGFPAPEVFLVGAIVFELIGGLSLFLGFQTRIGVVLLIVFLALATMIFHVPGITDAAKGQQETIQTLKNLAIIGALIKFWADGAGRFALDNYLSEEIAGNKRATA